MVEELVRFRLKVRQFALASGKATGEAQRQQRLDRQPLLEACDALRQDLTAHGISIKVSHRGRGHRHPEGLCKPGGGTQTQNGPSQTRWADGAREQRTTPPPAPVTRGTHGNMYWGGDAALGTDAGAGPGGPGPWKQWGGSEPCVAPSRRELRESAQPEPSSSAGQEQHVHVGAAGSGPQTRELRAPDTVL